MLDCSPMLKKIWQDPVWSKVIAAGIIAIAASASLWFKLTVPGWLALVSIVCAVLVGFMFGIRQRAPKPRHKSALHRMAFMWNDELTKHGWAISHDHGADGRLVRSFPQSSPERARFMRIEAEPGARLDYLLEPGAFLADSFELEYRPEREAAFYVRISVFGALVKQDEHWLNYHIGRGSPKRFAHNEWTLFVEPSHAAGGWLNLQRDILQDFSETFGGEDLKLDHINGFRIRGTISIAALTLYRSRPQ